MPTKQKVTNCMVVGDSIVRNVGVEHEDVKVVLSGDKNRTATQSDGKEGSS